MTSPRWPMSLQRFANSTEPMPRFLAIGECMVELSDAGHGLLRQGFAGDTFNTAWYARHLLPAAWSVSYLTALGDDPISGEMRAFMQSAGVDTAPIRVIPGASPGLYLITVKDGERSFTYWRDTSAAKRLADDIAHVERHCASADVLHFSAITLGILPPDAAITLIRILGEAAARGALVSFDTNYRPKVWRGRSDAPSLFLEAARVSSVVLPGLDDEQAVFGDFSSDAVAKRYMACGARVVVVKNGARGADVYDGAQMVHVPASPSRSIVDTSAAGDSFAAGFLTRYAQRGDAVDAARYGADVAADVISHRGALAPLSSAVLAAARI